jgi:hypothetical protein
MQLFRSLSGIIFGISLASLVMVSVPAAEELRPPPTPPSEVLVDGGRYAISVFRMDGTPASEVAAKAAAQMSKGLIQSKGGGGWDTGMPGFQRWLYVRVNFPDDAREFITEAEANRSCRDVSDFFLENSYGKAKLVFDVTPLLTMPSTYTHYRFSLRGGPHVRLSGVSELMTDAALAASDAGYNGPYGGVIVAHRPMFYANSSVSALSRPYASLSRSCGSRPGAR